jgi:hypothetical protein
VTLDVKSIEPRKSSPITLKPLETSPILDMFSALALPTSCIRPQTSPVYAEFTSPVVPSCTRIDHLSPLHHAPLPSTFLPLPPHMTLRSTIALLLEQFVTVARVWLRSCRAFKLIVAKVLVIAAVLHLLQLVFKIPIILRLMLNLQERMEDSVMLALVRIHTLRCLLHGIHGDFLCSIAVAGRLRRPGFVLPVSAGELV